MAVEASSHVISKLYMKRSIVFQVFVFSSVYSYVLHALCTSGAPSFFFTGIFTTSTSSDFVSEFHHLRHGENRHERSQATCMWIFSKSVTCNDQRYMEAFRGKNTILFWKRPTGLVQICRITTIGLRILPDTAPEQLLDN